MVVESKPEMFFVVIVYKNKFFKQNQDSMRAETTFLL